MAYKYSVGRRDFGDIDYEGDDNTQIDFDADYIALVTNGISMLAVSGSSVGIGTTTPDYTLDVAGDIGVNQYIYHNGDSNTWINFTDNRIRLNAGGNNFIDCEDPGNAPHKVRINNGGNNIDFVIKDNSNNVYFTADASTARIGIGTDTPAEALHVAGNLKVAGDDVRIKIDGDTDSHPGLELYENGTRKWIVFNDYTNDNLTFKTDNTTRMSIEQAGNVGIGTTAPIAKLDVAGKIAITTEVSTPSQPSDGQGYIYSKSDGKLYWRSHDQSETDLTATGGASSIVTNMTHHRYNDGSGTGLEYIPWAGTSEQNSPSWITQGVAPYAGKLLKVLIRSSKNNPTMGSTIVGIHTNVDGNTVVNQTPEETQTVNVASANTTYTFTFANNTHFGPGDVIGVSIDPTNAHGNVNVTCVWEYDTSA